MLNRIVRYTSNGWELEADPRHAELLVEQLCVKGKGVQTAGDPEAEATLDEMNVDDEVGAVEFEGQEVTAFRSMAARCM